MPAPPETDIARIRKYCRGRVPARFRHQVRVEAAVRGNSVTIFECRPPWHPNLNGRWHRYDDLEPSPVDKALHEIKTDPTCIFWG